MPLYKLRDWIPIDNLDWNEVFYTNSAVTNLLSKYSNKLGSKKTRYGGIHYERDIINKPHMYDYIFKYSNGNWISIYPQAIQFLRENPDKICWYYFSANPAAIDLLRKNPDKIDWYYLSKNPAAIDLLRENPHKICWYYLSENPSQGAIDLLRENPNKINWYYLSANPVAMNLIRENPDKINWSRLCSNPAAIELLRENPDKINWTIISSNPSIFEYDYAEMRASRATLHEELIAVIFHPRHIAAFLEAGGDLDEL